MPDIIIVEDNIEIGTLLCDFIRKENYTVSLAETGEKALDIFERYGANLIVLDIGLPGVDGFSVCAKMIPQSVCNTVEIQIRCPLNITPERTFATGGPGRGWRKKRNTAE